MERAILASVMLLGTSSIFAAAPLDLSHFKPLTKISQQIKEVSRSVGANHVLHVRVQQEYKGYPVFGGDAVLHYGNQAKISGTLYQDLDKDLANAPAYLFTEDQAQKALHTTLDSYQQKDPSGAISQQQSKMMVYVDKNKKAHFVYRVSFVVEPEDKTSMPSVPTYLVDAANFKVYEEWNNLMAADMPPLDQLELVPGGGLGGNAKVGQKIYDGMTMRQGGHEDSFVVARDAQTNTCYMINNFAKVRASRIYMPQAGQVMNFPCKVPDANHNNVYWSEAFDQVGESYSPANDAMHHAQSVRDMFIDWYHMPVLGEKNGAPATLSMVIHYGMNNAYYLGGILSIGDGLPNVAYPYTTRDIIAHEMSHIFTEQHAKLNARGIAGGLSESFGDVTAKVAELYVTGKNSWEFGADVSVAKGAAIRYLDKPSKDCGRRNPCSIDNVSQYKSTMDTHQTAGIFNRAFYLLASMPEWNIKLVYDLLVIANMQYWTSEMKFNEAACGVINAAQDLGYDTAAPISAFQEVGIDATHC